MTVAELPLWTGQVPGALGNEEEDRPSLISYLIPGDERRAAVVVCPGGGYARRAAHEGEPIARWLNSLGLHAFVLRYRVAPIVIPIL